jgi:predicted kinase
MDFEDRGRRDLAWRVLNAYLETTGDYRGVVVLRFYLVYRALVRAKVHALRARQHGIEDAERARLGSAARDYIALAARYAYPATPLLIITHGLSGSGKTTAAQVLLERFGAVRVRSDIERKRLHGLPPLARSGSVPGGGLYTTELTHATYEHLLSLACGILEAGYTVVVDAAFLRRAERDAFRALAASLHVSFRILAFAAPIDVLKKRVVQRFGAGADASEADLAVLERQLEFRERLEPVEEASTVQIDTATPVEPAAVERLLERISGQRLVNPDNDPASTASRDPGLRRDDP